MEKVKGKREEVRGKVEEAQGETYEATADGFFQWCSDKGLKVPMLFMRDYCDIENMRRKFEPFSTSSMALDHALNELRREYFDNIKLFLIDCSRGVTRDKFRKPSPSQEFWRTGIESYSRERLSPKQRRLLQKNTRSEAEAADYMKSLEKTRLDNLGKFLLPKASGEEGKGKGKKG